MNTHIVRETGGNASHLPNRSFQFVPSHSLPHPHTSNENINRSRNTAIWPARSTQPRVVIGLCILGSRKPVSPGCTDA